MKLPLSTTTRRIIAYQACQTDISRVAQLLGITEPSDEPITYAQLLDTLGLDDALKCCRTEPDLASHWRRFAVWCARQVQHLMTDPRSLAALDAAERHAAGLSTDDEFFGYAWAAAWASDDHRVASTAALADAADAACITARTARAAFAAATWDRSLPFLSANNFARAEMRQRQAAAFRQLVTTGTLPRMEVQ